MASAVGRAARTPAACSAPAIEPSRCSSAAISASSIRPSRARLRQQQPAEVGVDLSPAGTCRPASHSVISSALQPGSAAVISARARDSWRSDPGSAAASRSDSPTRQRSVELGPVGDGGVAESGEPGLAEQTADGGRSRARRRPRAAPGRRSRRAGSSASRQASHSDPQTTARLSELAMLARSASRVLRDRGSSRTLAYVRSSSLTITASAAIPTSSWIGVAGPVDVAFDPLGADESVGLPFVAAQGDPVPAQCRPVVRCGLLHRRRGDHPGVVDVVGQPQRVDAGGLQPLLRPVGQVAAGRRFQAAQQIVQRRVAVRVRVEVEPDPGQELVDARRRPPAGPAPTRPWRR